MLQLLLLLCSVASAISSINGSASFGYYRDEQQKAHIPLVYSFSYAGLDRHGNHAYLDFFINNDFSINQWQVNASQARLDISLSQKKKSRIQLGRQLFLEGFDLFLLDGAQAPIYWSQSGGVWLYGGQLRVLDLLDSTSNSLFGMSVFESVEGFNLKTGYTSQQYAYGSVLKSFDKIIFSPTLITKQEWTQSTQNFSQSVTELGLAFTDDTFFAISHSLRSPRKLTSQSNNFVYYVLSQSAQETYQASFNYNLNEQIVVQLLGRQLRYKSGIQTETSYQQELNISWAMSSTQTLTPVLGHILGYGGELWDTGLQLKSQVNEKTNLKNEISAAYLNKINNITGWAYQVRSGLNFEVAPRWLSSVWVEVERNHLFTFDARILANVTYFN